MPLGWTGAGSVSVWHVATVGQQHVLRAGRRREHIIGQVSLWLSISMPLGWTGAEIVSVREAAVVGQQNVLGADRHQRGRSCHVGLACQCLNGFTPGMCSRHHEARQSLCVHQAKASVPDTMKQGKVCVCMRQRQVFWAP
eukprot:1153046-Pelagomonas_calceolata.AAC.2